MARHNVLKISNCHVMPFPLCLYWTVYHQIKSCVKIYQTKKELNLAQNN